MDSIKYIGMDVHKEAISIVSVRANTPLTDELEL